jgi:hypothetical protein
MFYRWLQAFILTLLFELPVYLGVARFRNEALRPTSTWIIALGAVAASTVTHPLLWFVWRKLFRDYVTYVASGEALVVIIETFMFYLVVRPITLRRAALASLLANAFSYGCGYLLYHFGVLR